MAQIRIKVKITFKKTDYSRTIWRWNKKTKYFWIQYKYYLLTIQL